MEHSSSPRVVRAAVHAASRVGLCAAELAVARAAAAAAARAAVRVGARTGTLEAVPVAAHVAAVSLHAAATRQVETPV
jgi:hypothetical protein